MERVPLWQFLWLLLPVIYAVLGFGGVYDYIWVPAGIVLFIGLIAFYIRALAHQSPFPWHPIMAPMAGFALWVGAQEWFHRSIYPGATLTGLLWLAGCGCVFAMALAVFRDGVWAHRFLRLAWGLTGLLSAEAIVQFFTAHKYIYWFHDATYATPVGPFVYHNFYSGCLDLLLPLAVLASFQVDTTHDPVWVTWLRRGIVPGLGLASVVISRSRGGFLTLMLEAALALFFFRRQIMRSRRARKAVIACLGFCLGFILLANWGPMQRRLLRLNLHETSVYQRLFYIHSCWNIFLAHPLFGSGWNTFAVIYPKYQLFDVGLRVLFAHNDFMQTLAETGWVGGIFILVFLAIWLGSAVKLSKNQRDSAHHIHIAAWIATAGFLFHSSMDFLFHAPGLAMLFYVMLALALSPAAITLPLPGNRARHRHFGHHRSPRRPGRHAVL